MFLNEAILTFCVICPSKNTPLKHVGGFAVYNTINLHIFICACWSISHNESSLHDHESFQRVWIGFSWFKMEPIGGLLRLW